MGKGIKMRLANSHRGVPFAVAQLQRMDDAGQATPDLVCDGCGCNVRFVPGYKQNRANRVEPVVVPPYIGLTSGSEHVTGCRYDAKGRLKIIAAQSDPDFLHALSDGKRELRLLALHNCLWRYGKAEHAPSPNGKSAGSNGGTITVVANSDKQLDSYLRTTADLLALRAACGSDEDLAAELVLRLGSKRIPWKSFFFDDEHLAEAWELVRKGGANAYPIAIACKVRNVYQPPAGTPGKSSFLNCRPLFKVTSDPDRVAAYEICVGYADGAWLAGFPVGSEIVMFGLWKAADITENVAPDKRDPKRKITYISHKLTLWPQFKKQVLAVA